MSGILHLKKRERYQTGGGGDENSGTCILVMARCEALLAFEIGKFRTFGGWKFLGNLFQIQHFSKTLFRNDKKCTLASTILCQATVSELENKKLLLWVIIWPHLHLPVTYKQGLKKYLNSNLPFRQADLRFFLPGAVVYLS